MLKRWILTLVMALAVLQPVSVLAEEEAATQEDYVGYIELKPFIANYGGQGPTRFLKCEVTIQVGSEAAHHAVNYHMPQIRNDLVFLLSAQMDEDVQTVAAQKVLAEKALKRVQQVLLEEEGEAFVNDLFFTSFVTQ